MLGIVYVSYGEMLKRISSTYVVTFAICMSKLDENAITLLTTLFHIFCKIIHNFQVIFKSIKTPEVRCLYRKPFNFHSFLCITGELGYDGLNGTRKIGPSYAKSVVYI